MTLQELLTATLQQLDRGTDAQTMESWRDKLTRYLNDAILDLSATIRPRRTDAAAITGGAIDLMTLPRRCVKVLKLMRGEERLLFYYGTGTDALCVPGAQDGAVQVTYRYLPQPLSADTDTPDLPGRCNCDGAIVAYAVGRERAAGDGLSLNSARACFELYNAAKRNLREDCGEADAYRIVSRF